MMGKSDLTSKMLAYKHLKDFNTDQAVDWAIEMLLNGYDTPSLLILASISKPTNFFEAEKYLLSSLNELDIELPEKHDAITEYCRSFIEKMANSIEVKSNLQALYSTGQTFDDDNPIFDFYLLYWAWRGLDYGLSYQNYVPEATKYNIEKLVVNKSLKWLENH
jgi:hypothetical protein